MWLQQGTEKWVQGAACSLLGPRSASGYACLPRRIKVLLTVIAVGAWV